MNCGNINFPATFQNFKYQILVSVNKRMIIQLKASLGFFTEFYIAKYFTNKKSFNSKHGYIQVFFLCIASCKGTFTDNGRVTADVNVDGWWKKSKTAPHWRYFSVSTIKRNCFQAMEATNISSTCQTTYS